MWKISLKEATFFFPILFLALLRLLGLEQRRLDVEEMAIRALFLTSGCRRWVSQHEMDVAWANLFGSCKLFLYMTN